MSKITVFWFRRDLRLEDNVGLFHAAQRGPVLPLFIFDETILERLENEDDPRIQFIRENLVNLKSEFREKGSDLWVRHSEVPKVWKKLIAEFDIDAVYTNHDYEPRARHRDHEVATFLKSKGIEFHSFKDQTLFEKNEILTDAGKPYTVYTPYKRKVLQNLKIESLRAVPSKKNFRGFKGKDDFEIPSLQELGFKKSGIMIPPNKISKTIIKNYDKTRDLPADEGGTSHLGVHLRFGTLSIRELARASFGLNNTFLSELIWRDFFTQVLWHHPHVVSRSFRPEYDNIAWRNSDKDFAKWCEGKTGYPLVDAGMRELNSTGFMHNRVRMLVASFLTKHLLIHWSKGERYFAQKLLDYDMAANNGNWQWAAGTGCDAAPYFRIFNPMTQAKKFDPDHKYIRRWVPEYGTSKQLPPMIDHDEARGRCLSEFQKGLKK